MVSPVIWWKRLWNPDFAVQEFAESIPTEAEISIAKSANNWPANNRDSTEVTGQTTEVPQSTGTSDRFAEEQINPQVKHETLEPQGPSSRSSSSSTVGWAGVIVAPEANIRRLPSMKSSILSVCPCGTKLALCSKSGIWYGVIMSDMSTGWIAKSTVRLLNVPVTAESEQPVHDLHNK